MISPFPSLARLRPPVRRVAALDPGNRCLKLLLAETDFGRLRIRKEELMDLKAEGLMGADEVRTQLLATLDAWGSPPLALVLPQHQSISQVIDLPVAPESEVKKLIEEETLRVSGVTESRIVYDFVRVETPSKNRQQFWVTFCQEAEIRERIVKLGVEQEALCDVTTPANALVAAYRATAAGSENAILVDLGAQTTVVVVIQGGQGAFATSFQMGGDFLTRSLARARGCTEEAAEELKRNLNLFQGPEADPQFVSAVDGWIAELNRQLKDWFERNLNAGGRRLEFVAVASGGGFDQPGLLHYLRARADLNLELWPRERTAASPQPSKGYEVAFGTALQALGYSAQPVSLLPQEFRATWQKRLVRQRLEFASLLLVAVCILLFALGTWHNLSLISRKQALLAKVQAGQDAFDENEAKTTDLVTEYETVRPLFASQQNTFDTLKSLALLQQSRSNRSGWYVLVADQQTYFSQPPGLTSTNKSGKTNVVVVGASNYWSSPTPFSFPMAFQTNASSPRPGLIAELCVPEDPEAARQSLGQIVAELQKQHWFSKVDLLSEDLRRGLADPKVVLPDRQFVFFLDFADTDFQKPAAARKSTLPGRGPRRNSRPNSAAENADNLVKP